MNLTPITHRPGIGRGYPHRRQMEGGTLADFATTSDTQPWGVHTGARVAGPYGRRMGRARMGQADFWSNPWVWALGGALVAGVAVWALLGVGGGRRLSGPVTYSYGGSLGRGKKKRRSRSRRRKMAMPPRDRKGRFRKKKRGRSVKGFKRVGKKKGNFKQKRDRRGRFKK